MEAVQLEPLGIAQAAAELAQRCSGDLTGAAESIPDSWVDGLSAAGDPEQVRAALSRWAATGVDSIVLQPLNGDPACLEEYVRWLSPVKAV
jgi:alkanesulfonate monooxygenase SsuD/methylene tetrahydromethanopterin reductase-like flavin-dependent oxidoreductase (luciferase family)